MTLTFLVGLGLPLSLVLGSLIIASFAGALLAPSDAAAHPGFPGSQWTTGPTPAAAPGRTSGLW